jgi:hypothetical protein
VEHEKDSVTPSLRAARWGSLLPLTALATSAACAHSHSDPPPIPVYLEVEPNDDPLTANAFGWIYPGDHFFIDGRIDDRGFDPFDGFAFTAAGPLHVDFQLWIDDPASDLDVCLYDPQLDLTLACFQTAVNPERGGVDVYAGGLDFHLVVESFVGRSDYSLEISVGDLFVGATALHKQGLSGTGSAAPAGKPEPAARRGYRRSEPEEEGLRSLVVLRVDPISGEVAPVLTVRRR